MVTGRGEDCCSLSLGYAEPTGALYSPCSGPRVLLLFLWFPALNFSLESLPLLLTPSCIGLRSEVVHPPMEECSQPAFLLPWVTPLSVPEGPLHRLWCLPEMVSSWIFPPFPIVPSSFLEEGNTKYHLRLVIVEDEVLTRLQQNGKERNAIYESHFTFLSDACETFVGCSKSHEVTCHLCPSSLH